YAPFLFWVTWVLAAWVTVVLLFDEMDEVLAHWPIALAMLVGSYVAGSTPMGGGTVGFPILVLLFDQPASLGRNFSFCIQAVGMSSAAIFILCSGRPLAGRMLVWAALGSAVSLPLAYEWLVPHVQDTVVKLLFACVWAGFGIMTLVKLKALLHEHHVPRLGATADAWIGLGVGLIGGVVASLTGVGIDMIAYSVLVLLYRCDLRLAIGTSVILMAWNSLLGVVVATAHGDLDPEVAHHWLAAAPVVLFGAPLGALMVQVISRAKTLVVVSILCLGQLVWTLVNVRADLLTLGIVGSSVLALNGVFHLLYATGGRLVRRRS
ncbi:MAG: sulfite exporter TauE/SafE family protein, partial [Phycisphaerales bacterium]|nr:sulfite exporter TauE/SafE family protein [Phycisphaerales bacterium]